MNPESLLAFLSWSTPAFAAVAGLITAFALHKTRESWSAAEVDRALLEAIRSLEAAGTLSEDARRKVTDDIARLNEKARGLGIEVGR